MWGKVIGWFIGFNPNQLVSSITGLLQARVQAQTNTAIEKIKAGEAVELKQEETVGLLAQLQQAILLADQKWPVTRWIRPGFAYLCMFHFGAIVLASCHVIAGPIEALPQPYAYLEAGIIGTYFLLRPYEKKAKAA